MKEIKVSDKLRGERRRAAVERAGRRVKDDGLYLIRRHNAWFRAGGHGYTVHLGAAGVFEGGIARNYLGVEGLSLVPVSEVADIALARMQEIAIEIRGLVAIISGAGDQEAPQSKKSREAA